MRTSKKGQRNMVSAALREVFNAEDLADARERSAAVTERLTPTAPKVAELLTEAEEDLLAFYRFPSAHWPKLRSTNNLERVNKEIARRSLSGAVRRSIASASIQAYSKEIRVPPPGNGSSV